MRGSRAQQPDREPVEAWLGHRPRRQHRPEQGHVLDAPAHRADGVERRAEREDPGRRHEPESRLQPDRLARGRRQADGAAGVGADAEIAKTGCERGGVPARGAPGRLARMRRIVARAVPLARAEHAPGELGQMCLADDDGACRNGPVDDDRIPLGHVVGIQSRPVRRADACGVDQILDEQRAAVERPVAGWCRLGDRRDDRVQVAGHLTTATASTSIVAPGTASPRTPTSAPAARAWPNARCCAICTCAASRMSVT